MVEADTSTKEQSLSEAGSPTAERELQNTDHRFLIKTTDYFGVSCIELSKKTGCALETLVGDILTAGYESIKALSNGNKQAIVSIKDHRIVVEGLRNKT